MNYIRKIRKIKNNSKALSPVIASIILIAVTVAVSVVVAAWMGGMTLGLMGSAEQVSVNAQATNANTIVVTARNTGASTVTMSPTATIDGVSVTVPGYGSPAAYTISKGASQSFTITTNSAMIDGAQYTLKMSTAKGTTLTSTVTYTAP
jgi:archaeal type IV pilus assembly protein PilA